jgi:hypothetical protein
MRVPAGCVRLPYLQPSAWYGVAALVEDAAADFDGLPTRPAAPEEAEIVVCLSRPDDRLERPKADVRSSCKLSQRSSRPQQRSRAEGTHRGNDGSAANLHGSRPCCCTSLRLPRRASSDQDRKRPACAVLGRMPARGRKPWMMP